MGLKAGFAGVVRGFHRDLIPALPQNVISRRRGLAGLPPIVRQELDAASN